MSQHFVEVCEFGKTHGQCRCPSQHKTVRKIKCDNANHHMPHEDPADTKVEDIKDFIVAKDLDFGQKAELAGWLIGDSLFEAFKDAMGG